MAGVGPAISVVAMHDHGTDGSFDTPCDQRRWPATGHLLLVLRGVLVRDGVEHDLELQVRRRDQRWDRVCIGEATSFNGALHEFRVRRGGDGLEWRFDGLIAPDPWVVAGGPLRVSVGLNADGDRIVEGRYAGELAGRPVSGPVAVTFLAARPSPRGVARPRLRILESDRLWDWSRAGRRAGAPPRVDPALPVLAATDFGLEPDSGRECRPALQAAVDAAAAAGGGVVQLPPGVLDYRVDGFRPPVVIADSRIVIRGAGSGPDGTLVVNHRYADHAADPRQPWKAGAWPMFLFTGRGPAGRAGQMGTDAPPAAQMEQERVVAEVCSATRGSPVLTVAPGHELRPGDTCILVHEEVAELRLIGALIGDACEPASGYRMPGGRPVQQMVTIRAVGGEHVELDAPVHWTRQEAWPARLLAVELLYDVGIADLRLRAHWDGYFAHHKSPEHDNGWDHINFQWCAESFVCDTVHENCTTAVGLGNCCRCTASGVRVTGNPGHNGICLGGVATACLVRDCDLERPMHAINLSGTPCGNVIHDCRISEPGGLDLHGSTGLDNLVDRLVGGVLVGGGSPAHVPPRHAAGLVLWNWTQGHYHPYRAWRRVTRLASWRDTPGFIAVGVHASDGHHIVYDGPDGTADADRCDDRAWVESLNQPVAPGSLYRLQRGVD